LSAKNYIFFRSANILRCFEIVILKICACPDQMVRNESSIFIVFGAAQKIKVQLYDSLETKLKVA